jgi:hypothetical protein
MTEANNRKTPPSLEFNGGVFGAFSLARKLNKNENRSQNKTMAS